MNAPKYEREIRALLEELDDFLPEDQPRPRPLRSYQPQPTQHKSDIVLPPVAVIMTRYAFFAALLLILFVRLVALPLLGGPFAAACVGVAAMLLLSLIVKAVQAVMGGARLAPRWRGEALYPPPAQPILALARWWRRVIRRES